MSVINDIPLQSQIDKSRNRIKCAKWRTLFEKRTRPTKTC